MDKRESLHWHLHVSNINHFRGLEFVLQEMGGVLKSSSPPCLHFRIMGHHTPGDSDLISQGLGLDTGANMYSQAGK